MQLYRNYLKVNTLQYIVMPVSNFLIWVIKSVLPLFSCSSDFEFGLGSFSLLEEITSGQEWANFLTPPQTSASAHLRPLQKVPKPTFSTQSLIPNHSCDNQRGFQDGQFSDISMVQAWPGDFQPAGMDISEEPQCVQSRGQQAGLMEHGHTPADATTRWQTRLLSQVGHHFLLSQSLQSHVSRSLLIWFHMQRTDIESNSVMTRRLQMNRKRHHHLTERREENLQLDINHPDQGQGHLRLLKSQVLLYHAI